MDFIKICNLREIQNLQSLLAAAKQSGDDLQTLAAVVDSELDKRLQDIPLTPLTPATRRRPDNITTCAVCGGPAVIVPLSRADRSPAATHAIQCQNRPATDQPWLGGMCGHTEYIVRGGK